MEAAFFRLSTSCSAGEKRSLILSMRAAAADCVNHFGAVENRQAVSERDEIGDLPDPGGARILPGIFHHHRRVAACRVTGWHHVPFAESR